MLFELKFISRYQIIILFLSVLIAATLSWLFEFQPRLRVTLSNVGWGVLSAALLIALLLCAIMLILRFSKKIKDEIAQLRKYVTKASRLDLSSAIVVTIAAEEFLLRPFVFNALASYSLWVAFVATGVIAFLLYARHLHLALFQVMSATVYAWVFLQTSSVLAVVLSHGIVFTAIILLLRIDVTMLTGKPNARPRY